MKIKHCFYIYFCTYLIGDLNRKDITELEEAEGFIICEARACFFVNETEVFHFFFPSKFTNSYIATANSTL
jgi:hypothetical protein